MVENFVLNLEGNHTEKYLYATSMAETSMELLNEVTFYIFKFPCLSTYYKAYNRTA